MSDTATSHQEVESVHPAHRCPACAFELSAELLASAQDGLVTCPRTGCELELELAADGISRPAIRSLQLVNGYSMLVLPFACPAGQKEQFERDHARRGRWHRRGYSLERPEDVERTEYFMPYARRFLFPSLFAPAGEQAQLVTCRHYEFDLAHLGVEPGEPLRLIVSCMDRDQDLPQQYHMALNRAELILFHYGVGFLLLHWTMEPPYTSYVDQMRATRQLRMIAPLFAGYQMPELIHGSNSYTMPQLLAYLLDEFSTTSTGNPLKSPVEAATVENAYDQWRRGEAKGRAGSAGGAAIPTSAAAAALPVRPIHDDRMLVYWFSCIDQETRPMDDKLCRTNLKIHSVIPFSNAVDGPGGPSEIESASTAWLRQRWQCFTKDGGGLVVFNTDRFHEQYLGLYHGTYYFDIFLLASLQRNTLLGLFERLSDIPALTQDDPQSRKTLRRVRKDLLMFKNQCWFSQITNRERGMQLWRTWQETFETRTLLNEVNDQAEELSHYLQARTRERVEWLVRLGGFLAVAVPAVLGIDVLLGKSAWVERLELILFIALIVGSGIFAWVMLSRVRDD